MRLATRRTAALVLVPLVAGALAGCGVAGEDLGIRQQTQIWYGAGDGGNVDAEHIGVRNAVVVADEDGSAATVLATFSNLGSEDDELVQVMVNGSEAQLDGRVTIPARGTAALGTGDGPRALVAGAGVTPGRFAEVEFVFNDAPRASLRVLTQEPVGIYEAFGPSAAGAGLGEESPDGEGTDGEEGPAATPGPEPLEPPTDVADPADEAGAGDHGGETDTPEDTGEQTPAPAP